MRRVLLIAMAGFVFGALSAYLSVQIFNSIDVDNEHPKNHWYDGFMVSMIPAGIVNHLTLRLDLASESEERIDSENIVPLMLLNGAGWLIIVLLLKSLFLLTSASLVSVDRALKADLKSFQRKTHAR